MAAVSLRVRAGVVAMNDVRDAMSLAERIQQLETQMEYVLKTLNIALQMHMMMTAHVTATNLTLEDIEEQLAELTGEKE